MRHNEKNNPFGKIGIDTSVVRSNLTVVKKREDIGVRIHHSRQMTTAARARARTKNVMLRSNGSDAPLVLEAHRDPFEALRRKRTELAHAQDVPPYAPFHEKPLIELAAARRDGEALNSHSWSPRSP